MVSVVYGADWCAYCHVLRQWLDNNHIDYQYRNVDHDNLREEMAAKTDGNQTIPVLFIGDKYWINPNKLTLDSLYRGNIKDQDESIHLKTSKDLKGDKMNANNMAKDHQQDSSESVKVWDCLMIGAGPANLAAAVYTAREDISTVIVEKAIVGGLAAITDKVDNYPGFPEGIEGIKLADNLEAQAKRFGAVIELDEVKSLSKNKDNIFDVELASQTLKARTILVGTGSEWKKLGIPGEAEFYGKGVHNCATCDGAFYRDKRLVVIGSGNSSAQESLFLTKFASKIDILIRGPKWKASDVLIHEIEANNKINVHFNTVSEEIIGQDNKVTAVRAKTNGKSKDFATDGIFVFIGLRPVTYFLEGSGVELDEYGFVKTDRKLKTNVAGIFCAGDVRSGATMQIASAVGEGASAALSIREYLEANKW